MAGFAVAAMSAGALRAVAIEVRVQRIDGTSVTGEWTGLEPAPGARLLVTTGADRQAVRLADVASVSVGSPTSRDPGADAVVPEAATRFHLADGARLSGQVIGWVDDAILARTAVSPDTRIPIDRLAALQWLRDEDAPRAAALFRNALRDRLPGQDVLITADADEPKVLRGRIARIEADSGVFVIGGQSRTFPTDKAFGVVFATGAAKPGASDTRLALRDGSSLGGRVVAGGEKSVRLETSFGLTTEVELSAIERMEFRNDRVTYLSDLDPIESRAEGRLHRPWPIQRDRCVNGGPIVIEGRRFDKGLSVHSLTQLTYAIAPGYESFAATVGLDDAVRPRGSVVFRVLGDGRTLYQSDVLTGQSPPVDVLVSIRGVRQLVLVAEYGDELDLSDYADWGGARILRADVQ